MSERPVLELPAKPSFMVANGKTFILEEVNESPQDMLRSVEQFYMDNLEGLREKLARHISEESQADLNAQVQRIERHLASGIVALPEGVRESGSVLFLQTNKVYRSRIVLFRPTRISVVLSRVVDWMRWIDQDLSRRDAERYTKFCDWARPLIQHYRDLNQDMSAIKIDVSVNQDMVIEPMVVSYIIEENHIYGSPRGVHPHIHGHGQLCTGNTNAQVFWDDPQFKENFNSLNPHSWANSATRCAVEHKYMLKNQYFVEGRVRTQEASSWRV